MTKKQAVQPPPLPQWFTEGISDKYKAGIASVFLLHGDTTCLVANPMAKAEPRLPYIPLFALCERVFANREMVIFYNIATGMRFLTPEMEKAFRTEAGLQEDDDAAAKDPVAAAKAGLAAKRQLPQEPEICLPLMEKVLQKLRDAVIIIDGAHNLLPEQGAGVAQPVERTHIARMLAWAQDSRVKKKSNIVLLITDLATKVSSEVRQSSSRIPTVFIPKPSADERRQYIMRQAYGTEEERVVVAELATLRGRLKKAKGKNAVKISGEIEELEGQLEAFPQHFVVPDDFDVEAFVGATQGMNLRQVLEIFRVANQAGRDMDISFVKEKKAEILNDEYGDVMEIAEPDWSLDQIGGLEKPKAYFAAVIDSIRRGEKRLIPQGITIMGPPGTGKTALLEALAKGADYNFVKMKNARSMWVGMSEERTERQIQGLRALAPVIVMNDEADLGDADRDSPKGDSGVSERIMQSWMRFLSEPGIRGQILMVNCTNRPDRMDAAMKRSGRSDDRIAILMPSEPELEAIFGVMFKRYDIPTTLRSFAPFVQMVKGRSGADVESITLKSLRFAGEMRKEKVDAAALRAAIEDFIPSADQADIDFMTLLAISESSSKRLIPGNAPEIVQEIRERNLVPNLAEMIAHIESREIIPRLEAA